MRTGLLAFLFFAASLVYGANKLSLVVAPPLVEKTVRPGATIKDAIVFKNHGVYPVMVAVSLIDFAVDENGDVIERPPGTHESSLVPFLRVTPLKMRVAPDEEVFFRYSVSTPKEFKQLRSLVSFAARPIVERAPNQVLVVPRIGVPVYVENVGAQAAALDVENVECTRSPDARDTIVLKLTVHNHGERNIRPTGFLDVRSADRKFQKSFTFNEGHEPVLPGQRRKDWTLSFGPVPEGDLTVSLRFAKSFRESFSGQYSVAAAR